MTQPIVRKFALLALATALVSLGLTACKSANEHPSGHEHPAKAEPAKKSDHPEHPR
jgi:hypothetical protein